MNVAVGTDLPIVDCNEGPGPPGTATWLGTATGTKSRSSGRNIANVDLEILDVGSGMESSSAVSNEDLLNTNTLSSFDMSFDAFEVESLSLTLNSRPRSIISVSDLPSSAEHFSEPCLWEFESNFEDDMINTNADKSFVSVSPETEFSENDLDHSTFCKKSFNHPTLSTYNIGQQHEGDEVNNYDNESKLTEKEVSYYSKHTNFSQMKQSSYISSKNHWGDSNSKNAIAARDNRLKKKQYIAGLEESVKIYRIENQQLSEENKKNIKKMQELKKEVIYLKNIIANQTTLAAILKNVSKTPGISLSTSFNSAKSSNKTASDSKNIIPAGKSKVPTVNCVSNAYIPKSSRNLRSSKLCPLVNDSKRKHLETSKTVASKRRKSNRINDQFTKYETIVNVEDSDSECTSGTEGSLESSENVGICLHVSGNNVSLEMCSKCNARSFSEIMTDHSYVKN